MRFHPWIFSGAIHHSEGDAPLEEAAIEEMSASQVMQEQYWERTHGAVRTAMENCLLELDKYGFKVEMGHKEVGGLKADA